MLKNLIGHKPKYLRAIILQGLVLFLKRKEHFHVSGKRYRYFNHRYNLTFLNERTVEVPVAEAFHQSGSSPMLEVGNVLGHYGFIGQTILDKYEKNPGVINEDIFTYRPDKKFQSILSLSTVEHIGQDEGTSPDLAWKAILHLETLLAPGGSLLITFPLGYNASLDKWIFEQDFFQETIFLRRISLQNEWVEIPSEEARGAKFNHPYPFANVLCIGKKRT